MDSQAAHAANEASAPRALRDDEESEWLDLLGEAFADKGTPRSFFQRHREVDPHWYRDGVRVCAAGGRLVSTVRVYRRRVQLSGGRVADVGAIGDVATLKSHRGRGLAAALLDDAHRHMDDTGRELAVLHTSVRGLAEYYGRHGYRSVPVRSLVFELAPGAAAAAAAAAGDALRSVPVPSLAEQPALVDRLAELHRRGTQGLVGCFSRTPEYWRSWVVDAVAGLNVRIVTTAGGECVGYGVSRAVKSAPWDGMLQNTEFFADGGEDTIRRCFMCYLAGELEASPTLSRVRVLPAVVNPKWLAPASLTTPAAAGEAAVGPVKDCSTVVRAGLGECGSLVWLDEGQMYRFSGASAESLFGDGAEHVFFSLDSF